MLHGTEKAACIEDIWKYSRTELLTGKVLIAWKATKMLFTCARFTIWQIFCGNLPFPYQESSEISPDKYPHQLESRCVPGFYEATGGNILVCCLLSWAHEKWVSFTGVMLTQPEELATWRLEVTVREVLIYPSMILLRQMAPERTICSTQSTQCREEKKRKSTCLLITDCMTLGQLTHKIFIPPWGVGFIVSIL